MECPICLEKISFYNNYKTKCSHNFHFNCLLTYFNFNNNKIDNIKCPYCKTDCNIYYKNQSYNNINNIIKILYKQYIKTFNIYKNFIDEKTCKKCKYNWLESHLEFIKNKKIDNINYIIDKNNLNFSIIYKKKLIVKIKYFN